MVRVTLGPRDRVHCTASCEVPVSAGTAWGQMRSFRRFITLDPFHHRVVLHAPRPAAGARFDLVHRFLAIRLVRRGRILKWVEGRGYAFSDLSCRGPRCGFPHIYAYTVEPLAEPRARVTIAVRGRWTTRWLPRPLVHVWLYTIMWWARQVVRAEFAALRRARPARG